MKDASTGYAKANTDRSEVLEVLVSYSYSLAGSAGVAWQGRFGMGDNGEDEQGGEVGAKGEHDIVGMTDTDFAVSVDALLWVPPSGEMHNNVENFKAVGWSLAELETSIQLLADLINPLIALTSWREHPQLAVPMLEALLFTEALAGQSETPGPKV